MKLWTPLSIDGMRRCIAVDPSRSTAPWRTAIGNRIEKTPQFAQNASEGT